MTHGLQSKKCLGPYLEMIELEGLMGKNKASPIWRGFVAVYIFCVLTGYQAINLPRLFWLGQ